MKILSAYTNNFKDWANRCSSSVINNGYTIEMVNIDGVDMSQFNGNAVKATFKPKLILDRLQMSREPILWMDSDCIMADRVDELDGDWDVAVTLRRPEDKRGDEYDNFSGYLNTGVMFFNNTEWAEYFLEKVIEEIPNTFTKGDQEAISNLVLRGVEGVRIKTFSCDDYNFFYFPEDNKAKILHFKSDKRHFYETCKS